MCRCAPVAAIKAPTLGTRGEGTDAMEITRRSMLTGTERTIDIPVTHTQLARWQAGELIQHVMPELSSEEREYLITGITPEEMEMLYGHDD